MKRYLLPALLLLFIGATSCAHNKNGQTVDDLFKEFSNVENAEYVNIPPFLMKVANVVTMFSDDDAAKIVGKVKSVKVLTLDESPAEDKHRLGERISDLSTKGYEELLHVNDNGEHVRIFARMDKKSTIRQLIVLCTDSSDCVLVSMNGKFTKDDIQAVVNSSPAVKNGGK